MTIPIAAVLAISFSGCRKVENALNETMNAGTMYGIERCMEINKSEMAGEELVALSCFQRIDKEVPDEIIAATARVVERKPLEFLVEVHNNSSEYIVTRAEAVFSYIDGGGSVYLREDFPIGIEPKDYEVERIYFRNASEEFASAKFCENAGDTRCLEWYLNARGVTLR